MMRGYRRLKREGRLDSLVEIRDALAHAPLSISRSSSALIFGAARAEAERVVRQYLLVRVGHLTLNRALLEAGGRGKAMLHPLPAEWRTVLRDRGYTLAPVRSALVWQGYLLGLLGYGMLSMLRKMVETGDADRPARAVFFDRLTRGNLPQPSEDGRSYDIVSWYAHWQGRVRDVDAFHHDVAGVAATEIDGTPVRTVRSAVPALRDARARARFAAWSISAAASAIYQTLRGRWWHALMLHEAVAAAVVRVNPSDGLARDYLFHNSGWLYRPLWTYDAERRGSRILFYFYSTNCETFKRPGGYPPQANCWHLANWPRYLVWDDDHAAFIRRAVRADASVDVVGPIWFHTGAVQTPALPPRTVAVFDVQPHRDSRYRMLGEPLEYFTPDTANAFLLDVHDAVARLGGCMALKRKRDIGRLTHPSYRRVLEHLRTSPAFIAVDPDTAAPRLIAACDLVISMPFTSTALLGRYAGKPSIFYDPQGLIEKDDRGSHGIPVLTGPVELRHWVERHLSERLASVQVSRSDDA